MTDDQLSNIAYEEGSGNIFDDLRFENAEELFTRSQMGFHVVRILKDRHLEQREIAKLLGLAQPDVSHLLNGHFSRFTIDKLLYFIKKLDKKVTIRISSHKRGEPYQEIGFAP